MKHRCQYFLQDTKCVSVMCQSQPLGLLTHFSTLDSYNFLTEWVQSFITCSESALTSSHLHIYHYEHRITEITFFTPYHFKPCHIYSCSKTWTSLSNMLCISKLKTQNTKQCSSHKHKCLWHNRMHNAKPKTFLHYRLSLQLSHGF